MTIKTQLLPLLSALLLLAACINTNQNENTTPKATVPQSENMGNRQLPSKMSTNKTPKATTNTYCFGNRTEQQIPEFNIKGYSYAMVFFSISANNTVAGYYKYYPFETDSNVGHIKGTFSPKDSTIKANTMAYAEGSLYDDISIWKIENNTLISGYTPAQLEGKPETFNDLSKVQWRNDIALAAVNCEDLTAWSREMHNKTTVEGNDDLYNYNHVFNDHTDFSEQEVIIKLIEIDGNYETEELLFYNITNKQLLIAYKNNKLICKYANVKPPILFGSENNKAWKVIIFKKDKDNIFRVLKHTANSYPNNPSKAATLNEGEVVWHPEKYYPIIY